MMVENFRAFRDLVVMGNSGDDRNLAVIETFWVLEVM